MIYIIYVYTCINTSFDRFASGYCHPFRSLMSGLEAVLPEQKQSMLPINLKSTEIRKHPGHPVHHCGIFQQSNLEHNMVYCIFLPAHDAIISSYQILHFSSFQLLTAKSNKIHMFSWLNQLNPSFHGEFPLSTVFLW